ncbi:MAG: DNA gyrase subunit A, partial [Erysipelotrichaceae bacterium]|nr:DNA gyrase subunit A [Erysipelotrichaceae bacterium]
MAKKKQLEDNTKYIPALLEDIMGDRFGRYAKYIIQERALPDARDGLKPVQRRILYAMYHDGNTWDHAYRKSAKTVGLVIGNYHPHGDTSVYDAMVRMSQDWKVRLPMIDMHGNNGSIDDDPAAAMRYTEVRLAKVTQVMEDDLDKDTVEFAPNFDDTETEPTVLPVPFPVMLVNGANGIAAGYATNMPPHNLREVVDATIFRLNNPECSLENVMEFIQGPDFPTGGIVQGAQGIHDAFETGKGRIVVRAKAEIIDAKSMQQIVITEIPYEVIKSELVRKMDEIRINKDIDGILDVRDESDRNGLRITVDLRKDADAQMILNYFYKNTDLQIYYSYNNVTI